LRPPRASPGSPCHHALWHPLQAREPLGLISSQHPQIIRKFAEPKRLRAGDMLQLHCVYDNTASDRPSGYGSDETGEMCNQYLLSDLRLQARGSNGGAVLAALEPRSPGLGRRKDARLWDRGVALGRPCAPERPRKRQKEATWAPESAYPAASYHE